MRLNIVQIHFSNLELEMNTNTRDDYEINHNRMHHLINRVFISHLNRFDMNIAEIDSQLHPNI